MGNSESLTRYRSRIRRSAPALFFCGACLFLFPIVCNALTNIVTTRHNLSATGPGSFTASTETRICVFCHTPHNATPQSPLWNKDIQPNSYTFYTSPTLKSPVPAQPTGPTKLCLTCHDGTLALGAVVNPAGGITMGAGGDTFPSGSLSYFGLNLSDHHPVSFSYYSALPNVELASTPPANLVFGGGSAEVHCTTCHDPHDDTNGKFLAMDNRYSALCISCHKMTNWSSSSHATSVASVSGILPRPGKTWPTWLTVAEWGCEVCHTPHFAETPQWLLNYASSDYCLDCHSPVPSTGGPHAAAAQKSSSTVQSIPIPMPGMKDIRGQIRKVSGHQEQPGVIRLGLHTKRESPRSMTRHVTCVDCHNPHFANKQKASAPNASGMLLGVSGIDRNGMAISFVQYEYEVCFKCHGDYTDDVPYIPRVANTTNTRLAFDPINPSYHPVISSGKNPNIPSIPSSFEPSLSVSNIIYCTDCHRDDAGGAKGPHGSSYAPILRERYETMDNTPESYVNYALCYRCHNRDSIISDASFKKKTIRTTATGGGHSGHLAKGAPCSACHDPHGIQDNGLSGSHTHLINFDMRIVLPLSQTPPNNVPKFRDTGSFSGSCTLMCHGKLHNNLSYP